MAGGCGVLLTEKCQSALPLLSQVLPPLLNTQSSWVALAGTVTLSSQGLEGGLKGSRRRSGARGGELKGHRRADYGRNQRNANPAVTAIRAAATAPALRRANPHVLDRRLIGVAAVVHRRDIVIHVGVGDPAYLCVIIIGNVLRRDADDGHHYALAHVRSRSEERRVGKEGRS